MPFLSIQKLNAFYGKARALHDVSITCEKGEIIAIVGANGAGKSTLLDSVMGLTETTGTICFDGAPLTGKTAEAVERGIGYGPERFNLFPDMSVYDNLMVGAFTARDDIEENLAAVFNLFPSLEQRQSQETRTQSGGERQMVSLGRALMTNPRLLMVDEPTIGLAPKVCLEMARTLRRLRETHGLTIVIAEQNAHFAMALAERLYVLESGTVRAQGTVEDLRDDPRLTEAYFGH